MCHLVYTNFQRQGSVCNMTVGEVRAAKVSREFRVIAVWEHKTTNAHGAARLALHVKYYQLLEKFTESKQSADLVFVTVTGEKVTHIAHELEMLAEAFGKKFSVSPTMNRKKVATAVGLSGSELDEKNAAKHMSHSLDVHRSAYQHDSSNADISVERSAIHNCSVFFLLRTNL